MRLDRGHVHDRAACCGNERHEAAHEVGDAGEVLPHQRVLAALPHVEEGGEEAAACVVHQRVGRSELGCHLAEERRHGVALAHVEDSRVDTAAQLARRLRRRGQLLLVPVAERQIRAEAGKTVGDGGAQPDGGTRDDGHAASEQRTTGIEGHDAPFKPETASRHKPCRIAGARRCPMARGGGVRWPMRCGSA